MESRSDARKLCILLNISGFLDFLSVGMIMPQVSPRLREMGASPTVTGLVGSIYGGVQLLSSPMMGKVSDNIGRFQSLLLSFAMCSIGYSIVGVSLSVSLLAFGRFILGCFKHTQGISKAYLYDLLPGKEASAAIGRFHSFSSLGFILGPIIGGHITESEGGIRMAAFCSALLFMINAGMIWLTFPHSTTTQKTSEQHSKPAGEDNSQKNSNHPSDIQGKDYNFYNLLTSFKQSFSIKSIKSSPLIRYWDFLLVRFLLGLSILMFRNNLNLNLRESYGVSKAALGYVFSYTSAVSALVGFTVGYITQRYEHNEAKLFFHTTLLKLATLTCLSMAPSLPFVIAFLTPLSFGTSIARVSSTSVLVDVSGKQQVAAILGWNQSINSVSRMMAPALVGLIQEWSMDGATYLSLVTISVAALILTIWPEDSRARKMKQKDD